MIRLVLLFFALLVCVAYARVYWQWLRYLIWKWKAIPYYERYALISQGLCWKCGYDTRATPDRCPECGEAVVQKKVG